MFVYYLFRELSVRFSLINKLSSTATPYLFYAILSGYNINSKNEISVAIVLCVILCLVCCVIVQPPVYTSHEYYPTSERAVRLSSASASCRRSISLWLKAMYAQVKRRLPGQHTERATTPCNATHTTTNLPHQQEWKYPHSRDGRMDRPVSQDISISLSSSYMLQKPSYHRRCQIPAESAPGLLSMDIFDVLISFLHSLPVLLLLLLRTWIILSFIS